MYNTVVDAQPEAEPNGTRITGTPSSFTHRGTISAPDDQDCYAFHGRAGDSIIIALNGDGRPLDAALELVGPDDSSLHSVNVTGVGGQEFLEYDDLPEDGAYAYCVLPAAGSGTGGTATYRVGLVRNGALYYPDWEHGIKWLNRPPEGYTSPGKELLFRIAVQNTSPLTIPGGIDLGLDYPASCLSFIEADPSPASLSAGSISWAGLKPDLAPGDVYSASARLRAEAGCVADVSMSLNLPYYVTYVSSSTRMAVYDHFLRLPVIRRTAP